MRQIALLIAAAFALTTSAKDLHKLVVKTNPEMKCERCSQNIKDKMKFTKGIKSLDPNHETKLVTIVYDADKGSLDLIQKDFRKAGYQIEVVSDTQLETKKN